VKGREYELDNRWIVPYNPYLSAKYNCHINVECAASIMSFKYIFKYVHKGTDKVSFDVHGQDEIREHRSARYVSACEAIWRIFGYWLHRLHPPVFRLPVHEPGGHMVTWYTSEDQHRVAERADSECSALTEFFMANRASGTDGEDARSLTYQEFPQLFAWKEHKGGGGHWSRRTNSLWAIGRMYFVPPTAGERFYVRLLLAVVRGPKSFQDLRTVDGLTFKTFKQACYARGLLQDDSEWAACLADASHMQTGYQLRRLFVSMLLFCSVSDPAGLWQKFKASLCDDIGWRLRMSMQIHEPTNAQIEDYGLYLIHKLLYDQGVSCASFL
jgi:hypothetical protein